MCDILRVLRIFLFSTNLSEKSQNITFLGTEGVLIRGPDRGPTLVLRHARKRINPTYSQKNKKHLAFNLVKFNIHIPLFNHKKTLILGCVQPAYQKFNVICSGVHQDLTFENVMGRFVPKHIPIIIYFYYSL